MDTGRMEMNRFSAEAGSYRLTIVEGTSVSVFEKIALSLVPAQPGEPTCGKQDVYLDGAGHVHELYIHPGAGWVAKAAMPDARNHIGYVAINGIAYAVGGQHLYNEYGGNDSEVDAYNPVTNQWTTVASLPFVWSSAHTTTMAVNGKIVIVGGQTNGGYDGIYLNNIEEYDPAANQWTSVGTLPEANEGEAAAYINGELIVADGTVDNLGGWAQQQTWIDAMFSV